MASPVSLWVPPRAGIQTDGVLSARLQIMRIYIREDGRLVIEFKTQAKFRGESVSAAGGRNARAKAAAFRGGGRQKEPLSPRGVPLR